MISRSMSGLLHQQTEIWKKRWNRAILEYQWPGNIRELKNVIERAVLIASNGTLQPELGVTMDSRKKVTINDNGINDMSDSRGSSEELDVRSLANIEKQHIQRVLNETSWRRTE